MKARANSILLIILFLAGIFLPGTYMLLNGTENSEKENVALFSDTLSLKNIPTAFNTYFNNSFSFRKDLIKAFYATRVFALGETFIDDKIIVGKDGWLYYAPDTDGYGISDYIGKIQLSESDLKKIATYLEEQNNWLKKKGIKYVVVICPNKQSIYPEYLPGSVNRGKSIVVDQVTKYLSSHTDVRVMDLRSVLLEEKKKNKNLLYYKTDSHWNYLGGLYASKYIFEKLNNENKNKSTLNNCRIDTKICEGKDISGMMGINSYFEDLNPEITFIKNQDSSNSKPKALVIHDSFYEYLQPYFNKYFSEVVIRQSYLYGFDHSAIEQSKPDVVIHELAERYINTLLRENPEIIK